MFFDIRIHKADQLYANQAGSSFPGPYDSTAKIDDAIDPFSPRVRNFDPFNDKFKKPNTFDFSFGKGVFLQKESNPQNWIFLFCSLESPFFWYLINRCF